MHFVHAAGVAHGDLAPACVGVSLANCAVALGGFSAARVVVGGGGAEGGGGSDEGPDERMEWGERASSPAAAAAAAAARRAVLRAPGRLYRAPEVLRAAAQLTTNN